MFDALNWPRLGVSMKITKFPLVLKLAIIIVSSTTLSWAATRTVNISNFAFTDTQSNNSTTVINEGDTVQWNWQSGTHSTTSGTCSGPGSCTASGIWDSTVLSAPNTFSFTFNNSGSFPYYCQVHTTGMLGKVIVNPVVTNTNDSGPGSLRQAILDVNADPDVTLITFNIPGGGVQTITPTSALPTITNPVLLDGYTQPGAIRNGLLVGDNANLLIEINGSMAGANVNGLTIAASGFISGLVINRFSGAGIAVQGNDTTIIGNFIGTDASGAVGLGNGGSGVLLVGASNIIIGGDNAGGITDYPSVRNIISGNGAYGVEMDGPSGGNHVENAYIGTNAAGGSALPNGLGGILIQSGAHNNQIGGFDVINVLCPCTAKNVISGNSGNGLTITGTGTDGNTVEGNFIGINAAGTAALSNNLNGVLVNAGARSNSIGVQGSGNVISGNVGAGIVVSDLLTFNNVIIGNFIGTNAAGNVAIANSDGILVVNSSAVIGGTNPVSRNVISGDTSAGIGINGGFASVQGNYIGTNAAGTAAVGNSVGVFLVNTNNLTIGGASSGNLISGNSADGIEISGGAGTHVTANLIGTDATGSAALPNGTGVYVTGNSTNNIIGGTDASVRNVLSGNTSYGVLLSGVGISGNIVEGNYIGTDSTGNTALGNGGGGITLLNGPTMNTIGGTAAGAGNVISGNVNDGVDFNGVGTTNLLQGNLIGTNAGGSAALGNSVDGVYISGGAIDNTVGGTITAARNVISGNLMNGVGISGNGTYKNLVQGNFIGTDISGLVSIGNHFDGIRIDAGGADNTILHNVISGNLMNGVSISGSGTNGNLVEDNSIGTDATGLISIGNHRDGVRIDAGAANNIIGEHGAGNTIASNAKGVVVLGNTATGNDIEYNSIFSNTVLGIDLNDDGV